MLTAAEVLLHTKENNTELPATGRERRQNRFSKQFQGRLGKSAQNRSAPATKQEAGHAAAEPGGGLAAGSQEAGLQERSKTAGCPSFQCLATALRTGVYGYSKRKPILYLLPCHSPRLFSSALLEFI